MAVHASSTTSRTSSPPSATRPRSRPRSSRPPVNSPARAGLSWCSTATTLDLESESQLLAVWPETAQAMTPDEVEELGYPLALGLWCGDHYQMSLQLYARPGRGGRQPERVMRRLKTLCSVASAALRGLHAGRRARAAAPSEPPAPVRDATFLCASFPYALVLQRNKRHCEPISAFCVAVDRLAELAHTHGPDAVDRAVRRVAEAIARSLRGSDVVARLDDDRILIVLPNTSPRDATKVAEIIRRAVDSACLPVGTLPDPAPRPRWAWPASPTTPATPPLCSPRPTTPCPAPAPPARIASPERAKLSNTPFPRRARERIDSLCPYAFSVDHFF